MGSAKRDTFGNKVSNPGPGQYQIPSQLASTAKYSMGLKTSKKSNEDSPGPGAYSPNHKSNASMYTMRTKTKSHQLDSVPGPGTYDS